ncbi:MAG: hypothetical protein AAFU66_02175 [Pseudomonadota bacterium]
MLKYTVFALSILTAFAAPAAASEFTAIQSVQRAVMTTNDAGEVVRVFEPTDLIAPGDELKYALTYENGGLDDADGVMLTMPVPQEVLYIENSATTDGVTVEFSADNGATYTTRADLTVLIEGQAQPASANDITHMRWTFTDALAPGEAGTVGYRGILR